MTQPSPTNEPVEAPPSNPSSEEDVALDGRIVDLHTTADSLDDPTGPTSTELDDIEATVLDEVESR